MAGGRFRNLVLALADALCVCLVWAFVVWAYKAAGFGHHYVEGFYLRMWPVAPAFVLMNVLFRLYHGRFWYPAAPLPPVEEMRRLMGSAAIVHAGVLVYLVLTYQTTRGYSRFIVIASGFLVALLAPIVRDLARLIMAKCGVGQIPVVVAGAGDGLRPAIDAIASDRYVGFRPVGYFDDSGLSVDGFRRLGGLRDVVAESRRLGVKTLVACEDLRMFSCQFRDFSEWFLHVEYMPNLLAFPVYGSHAFSCGGMCGLEMVNQGRMKVLRIEKWLLDKALSVVAFMILIPAMLAIALMVKATSRGPVLYGHERVGRGGRKFRCWKFRTMYADADARLKRILEEDPAAAAEWKANFKLKDDPRVTPFGRFLRRTSLDEIPQFFNVFAGSMALVGPRPIVEGEREFYGDAFRLFTSVKPGITGLWQVSGRSDTGYARRVALDVEYVMNWSPWLDVWILLRTVLAVITLKGAC